MGTSRFCPECGALMRRDGSEMSCPKCGTQAPNGPSDVHQKSTRCPSKVHQMSEERKREIDSLFRVPLEDIHQHFPRLRPLFQRWGYLPSITRTPLDISKRGIDLRSITLPRLMAEYRENEWWELYNLLANAQRQARRLYGTKRADAVAAVLAIDLLVCRARQHREAPPSISTGTKGECQ